MSRVSAFIIIILLSVLPLKGDTLYVHRVEADAVPAAVVQSNRYLRGANAEGEKIWKSMMLRLKYAVQPSGDPEAVAVYQGAGLSHLAVSDMLGSPWGFYVLQGAPLIHLSPSLSFCYELQFGGMVGWSHVGSEEADNHVLGSAESFYIGADLFLRWMLNSHWDLNMGGAYMHFSSANLSMPNEGLNMFGVRLSAACHFNRGPRLSQASLLSARTLPKGQRWVTEVILFGGWKRKSAMRDETYGVAGFSINPFYRLNEGFAIGPALDGVYDNSIHVSALDDDNTSESTVTANRKMALGLQMRAELTMPVLRIGAGAGGYFIGGFSTFYETLSIKADVSRHLFLNLGYCLYNYRYPNNLMIGLGYRIGTDDSKRRKVGQ